MCWFVFWFSVDFCCVCELKTVRNCCWTISVLICVPPLGCFVLHVWIQNGSKLLTNSTSAWQTLVSYRGPSNNTSAAKAWCLTRIVQLSVTKSRWPKHRRLVVYVCQHGLHMRRRLPLTHGNGFPPASRTRFAKSRAFGCFSVCPRANVRRNSSLAWIYVCVCRKQEQPSHQLAWQLVPKNGNPPYQIELKELGIRSPCQPIPVYCVGQKYYKINSWNCETSNR